MNWLLFSNTIYLARIREYQLQETINEEVVKYYLADFVGISRGYPLKGQNPQICRSCSACLTLCLRSRMHIAGSLEEQGRRTWGNIVRISNFEASVRSYNCDWSCWSLQTRRKTDLAPILWPGQAEICKKKWKQRIHFVCVLQPITHLFLCCLWLLVTL